MRPRDDYSRQGLKTMSEAVDRRRGKKRQDSRRGDETVTCRQETGNRLRRDGDQDTRASGEVLLYSLSSDGIEAERLWPLLHPSPLSCDVSLALRSLGRREHPSPGSCLCRPLRSRHVDARPLEPVLTAQSSLRGQMLPCFDRCFPLRPL